MGVAGAGSLIQVINAAMGNQHRFDEMKNFFGSVGKGDRAGVWEDVPKDFPNFRKEQRRQLDKQAKKRKAEESI
jgi:chlorophyllide a reductase subunit Y